MLNIAIENVLFVYCNNLSVLVSRSVTFMYFILPALYVCVSKYFISTYIRYLNIKLVRKGLYTKILRWYRIRMFQCVYVVLHFWYIFIFCICLLDVVWCFLFFFYTPTHTAWCFDNNNLFVFPHVTYNVLSVLNKLKLVKKFRCYRQIVSKVFWLQNRYVLITN
mgnify:CR=1 FL=1